MELLNHVIALWHIQATIGLSFAQQQELDALEAELEEEICYEY